MSLEEKIEKARTVMTNLRSFKDWSFAAYRVEEHEKDIVIEAVEKFYNALVEQATQLNEENTDDSSELCE